jgi:hypothetical protein
VSVKCKIHQSFHDGANDPANNASDTKAPAKTRNCAFWLINVLFSDEMSPKFGQLGGKKDKNVLDTGLAANNEYFWQEVAEKYQETNNYDEVAYHIEVASLWCEVTRSQDNKIAPIMTKAVELSSCQGSSRHPKWPTQVTFTPCLLRSLYCYGK